MFFLICFPVNHNLLFKKLLQQYHTFFIIFSVKFPLGECLQLFEWTITPLHCGSSQHSAHVWSACHCVGAWTQDIPTRTSSLKVSCTYTQHRKYFAPEKVFEISHVMANFLVVSVFTLYFYIGLSLVLHSIVLHLHA